jgi:hypothetical protein
LETSSSTSPFRTVAIQVPLGSEARYEQAESISLAFVTAPQLLPPRRTAVLILRDRQCKMAV